MCTEGLFNRASSLDVLSYWDLVIDFVVTKTGIEMQTLMYTKCRTKGIPAVKSQYLENLLACDTPLAMAMQI